MIEVPGNLEFDYLAEAVPLFDSSSTRDSTILALCYLKLCTVGNGSAFCDSSTPSHRVDNM